MSPSMSIKSATWDFPTSTVVGDGPASEDRLAGGRAAEQGERQPRGLSPNCPKTLMPILRGPSPSKGVKARVKTFFARAATAPTPEMADKLPPPSAAAPHRAAALDPEHPAERGGTKAFSDFGSFLRSCEDDSDGQVDGPLREAIDMVTRTVHHFDENPRAQPADSSLAVFEMDDPLCCTCERYILRILKYSKASPCNVVVGLVYLQRIHRSCPWLSLTPTNVQRLLLAAVMLATKFEDDLYYSNKYWGRIGEISLQDMNKMELILLGLLDFNCRVKREEYDAFVSFLRDSETLFQARTDRLESADKIRSQLSMSISSLNMNNVSATTSPTTAILSHFSSSPTKRRESPNVGRYRRMDSDGKSVRRADVRAPQHTTVRRRRSQSSLERDIVSSKVVREKHIIVQRMIESVRQGREGIRIM